MKKSKKHRVTSKESKDVILSKFTSGREKGVQKRQKTLLLEYKLQKKANRFVDRRIGEKDRAMTNDDRIMARFAAQQIKAHNKKQIFNLDNEEVLTHQGRTLQDIEKYDNPQSESEDEGDGKLEADFVGKAHFGGGLFTKTSNDDNVRSTIDQLIAESKKRKAERQQTKEETQTLTDKLDKDLKELLNVFTQPTHSESEVTQDIKPNKESYDVLVRELRFEPVGKPSNKSKTEEQLKTHEKERLLQMENERLERMNCHLESDDEEIDEKSVVPEFQSADSLDDGFDLNVFDEEMSDGEDDSSDNDDENGINEDENGITEDENDDLKCHENELQKKSVPISSNNPKSAKVPVNLEELLKLIKCSQISEKVSVIENLINDQRIHCGTSNKEHLMKFFTILLEYVDSLLISPNKNSWTMIDKLSPILFELVQLGGDEAAEIIYQKLTDKHSSFSSCNVSNVPTDAVVLLKLISLWFPTSDYYHSIATPACVFGSEILLKNSCCTLQQIVKGLFVATTMLEYVHLSRRFCPEAINFLKNILYTAAANFEDTYPPVRMTNKILVLSGKYAKDVSKFKNGRLSCSFLTEEVPQTNHTKLILIGTTVKLLTSFCDLYQAMSSCYAVWMPIEKLLSKLPVDLYPSSIQCAVEDLLAKITSISQQPLNHLVAVKKRPKALRLYEPNIRPIIEGRSFKTMSQAKLEKDKLMRLYKREKKAAVKEIRKDRNFLARVKISEQAKKDAERKNKVKQIFGWGQSQQSELKRMERKNKFKR